MYDARIAATTVDEILAGRHGKRRLYHLRTAASSVAVIAVRGYQFSG